MPPDISVLFNDIHESKRTGVSNPQRFESFDALPLELRMKIWTSSLKQNRLISLRLETNDKDVPRTSRNYIIHVVKKHRIPQLLRTSREARHAALRFYRLSIRMDVKWHPRLYLNPEFDYLHIDATSGLLLAKLLHDLKTVDPKHIGILNLGISGRLPRHIQLPNPRTTPPELSESFKTIVSNLDYVFFQHICNNDSRIVFNNLDMAEVRFNHSYPIITSAEAFDFSDDTRPIEHDLEKVSIGWDPRAMLFMWRQMMMTFNIKPVKDTRYAYHICAPTYGGLRNVALIRDDAISNLKQEQARWQSKWKPGGLWHTGRFENPDTKRDTFPMPVFGWWELPIDAFGELPQSPDYITWEMKTMVSLTHHRPRLMVMHLS